MVGRRAYKYLHQDDVALALQQFAQASELNSPLTELRVRRKDGTWNSCEGTGRSVASPDGRKSCVLIITRDISERRRLDREHALLAAIVESSDDAIVSNSPTGTS